MGILKSHRRTLKKCFSGQQTRSVCCLVTAVLVVGTALSCAAQTSAELQDYFKTSIGLSKDQIADIRDGKAVAKVLKSRTPAEIFVFGAVYIKGDPESYLHFASDCDRLRKLPEYLAIGKFSDPPQVSDLDGLSLDSEEVKALKDCRPGHCGFQLPAETIENIHQSINWSAPDLEKQATELLHQQAIKRLRAYQHEGNQALGVYQGKEHPTVVAEKFEYMLSDARVLPAYLPDFHHYLLAYPEGKPANAEELFYWAKVKFGLKPTVRMVQVVTLRGQAANKPACAIAEKQLYSSHYFETALDLTFCIRDTDSPDQTGFYLVKAMGSEQEGLTGIKGSIVRKVAVGRTASSLEKSLAAVKKILEERRP